MPEKKVCMGIEDQLHNYQPRYDEREPDPMNTFFSMRKEDIKKDKIYIADVCTQCGDVIARKRR